MCEAELSMHANNEAEQEVPRCSINEVRGKKSDMRLKLKKEEGLCVEVMKLR